MAKRGPKAKSEKTPQTASRSFETFKHPGKLIAKKDFVIACPPTFHRVIKKGDDVSDIPDRFKTNLITEGVI